MDRNDLAELPARGAAGPPGDVLDEIESARMGLGRRLGAHPAQDLLRIGQEGEDGGGRGRDLGLAPDDKQFIHWISPQVKLSPHFRRMPRVNRRAITFPSSSNRQRRRSIGTEYDPAVSEGQPFG